MSFERSICRTLHDEHRETIGLLNGLDDLLSRGRRGVPDLTGPKVRELLVALARSIDEDVNRHFAFEEAELFTRLAENGDEAIGEHLTEEHESIRPVGNRLAELARAALEGGIKDTEWAEFRALGGELIERMLAHIQKEEMALLPLLEDTLPAEDDLRLSESYSAARS